MLQNLSLSKPEGICMCNKGQTLVEALLATAVAITVIVALVGVGINSMRVANYSKNQAEATKLAREQLELLRNFRDTSASWSNFSTSVASCVVGSSCCVSFTTIPRQIVSYDINNCQYNNIFDVSFIADTSVADKATVTTSASFTEGSLTRNVTLTETFTNWRGS